MRGKIAYNKTETQGTLPKTLVCTVWGHDSWVSSDPWESRIVIPGASGLWIQDCVSTISPPRMSCKEKVVQSCFGAQNRSVPCSHSIPFKALKPVSGSMLLFRKFKASLGISERSNYSSSFKDEGKLGKVCCNWHSSSPHFKQNLWPSKSLRYLMYQGYLLNVKVTSSVWLYF